MRARSEKTPKDYKARLEEPKNGGAGSDRSAQQNPGESVEMQQMKDAAASVQRRTLHLRQYHWTVQFRQSGEQPSSKRG
eukprot:978016-Amphidinium_carterae.1